MCRKQPPQEPGSSRELAARPQAPRHAGQEGQARSWAGMRDSSSPGKGQPGLAQSLDPAVREVRGSAGSSSWSLASLLCWAGCQLWRG